MSRFLYENHRGSPTLILLNVLDVLGVLNVLHVLHVLHGRIVGLLGLVKARIAENKGRKNVSSAWNLLQKNETKQWRILNAIFFWLLQKAADVQFIPSKDFEIRQIIA